MPPRCGRRRTLRNNILRESLCVFFGSSLVRVWPESDWSARVVLLYPRSLTPSGNGRSKYPFPVDPPYFTTGKTVSSATISTSTISLYIPVRVPRKAGLYKATVAAGLNLKPPACTPNLRVWVEVPP